MTRGPDPMKSDLQVLRVFTQSPDPVLFAVELSEELNMTTQGVHKRMKDLVEDGLIHTKKPGKRTRIYWISRKGREYVYERSSSDSQ